MHPIARGGTGTRFENHGDVRLEFNSTLDEIVDANMRLAERTQTYRQERRQAQWLVAACYAIASVVAVLRGIDVSGFAGAITLALGLASGMLGFFVYGRFHDWYARRNCRRMVRELYRLEPVRLCLSKLRQDAFVEQGEMLTFETLFAMVIVDARESRRRDSISCGSAPVSRSFAIAHSNRRMSAVSFSTGPKSHAHRRIPPGL